MDKICCPFRSGKNLLGYNSLGTAFRNQEGTENRGASEERDLDGIQVRPGRLGRVCFLSLVVAAGLQLEKNLFRDPRHSAP